MTAPMDAAQIAAIVADAAAGTPGPWVSDAVFSYTGHATRVAFPDRFGVPGETIAEFYQNWKDAERTDQRISWKQAEANARRAANIPAMEATITAQAAELERLRAAMTEIAACLDGSPDYHTQGMGCGLEDRCITDRYDAMQYGWDAAIDRVYSEHVSGALEVAHAALKGGTQ